MPSVTALTTMSTSTVFCTRGLASQAFRPARGSEAVTTVDKGDSGEGRVAAAGRRCRRPAFCQDRHRGLGHIVE